MDVISCAVLRNLQFRFVLVYHFLALYTQQCIICINMSTVIASPRLAVTKLLLHRPTRIERVGGNLVLPPFKNSASTIYFNYPYCLGKATYIFETTLGHKTLNLLLSVLAVLKLLPITSTHLLNSCLSKG